MARSKAHPKGTPCRRGPVLVASRLLAAVRRGRFGPNRASVAATCPHVRVKNDFRFNWLRVTCAFGCAEQRRGQDRERLADVRPERLGLAYVALRCVEALVPEPPLNPQRVVAAQRLPRGARGA